MRIIGFTGYVALARVRGRIAGEIHAHEILQLPDDAAEDLLRTTKRACDLTQSRVKAPYGAITPLSMLGSRLWNLVR